MREEAVRLVREGLVLHARYAGERYFEASCDGKPVMLVDNSLEQLVIVLFADRWTDVPCVVPQMSHWSGRVVAEFHDPTSSTAEQAGGTSNLDAKRSVRAPASFQ